MFMPPPPPIQVTKAEVDEKLAALRQQTCEKIIASQSTENIHTSGSLLSYHQPAQTLPKAFALHRLKLRAMRKNGDKNSKTTTASPPSLAVPAPAIPTLAEMWAKKNGGKVKDIKSIIYYPPNFASQPKPVVKATRGPITPPKVPPKTLLSGPPSLNPPPTTPLPRVPPFAKFVEACAAPPKTSTPQTPRSPAPKRPEMSRTLSQKQDTRSLQASSTQTGVEMISPQPQRPRPTSSVYSVDTQDVWSDEGASSPSSTPLTSHSGTPEPRDKISSPTVKPLRPCKPLIGTFSLSSLSSGSSSESLSDSSFSSNSEAISPLSPGCGKILPPKVGYFEGGGKRVPPKIAYFERLSSADYSSEEEKPLPPPKNDPPPSLPPTQLRAVPQPRDFYQSGWPRSPMGPRRVRQKRLRTNQNSSSQASASDPKSQTGQINVAFYDKHLLDQPCNITHVLDAISERTSIAEDARPESQISRLSSKHGTRRQSSVYDGSFSRSRSGRSNRVSMHGKRSNLSQGARNSMRKSRQQRQRPTSTRKSSRSDEVTMEEICAFFDNYDFENVKFNEVAAHPHSRAAANSNTKDGCIYLPMKSGRLQNGMSDDPRSKLAATKSKVPSVDTVLTHKPQPRTKDRPANVSAVREHKEKDRSWRPPVPPKGEALLPRPATAPYSSPSYSSAVTATTASTHKRSYSAPYTRLDIPSHTRFECVPAEKQLSGDQGFDWSDEEDDELTEGEKLWKATAARLRMRGKKKNAAAGSKKGMKG